MITLYGMSSPNVLKVVLMLEETGLPYEFIRCDVIQGGQHRPDFLSRNPNAKVPLLIDEAGPEGIPVSLFESGAILIYLAEKTGRFLPAAPSPARYEVLQWVMWQMAGIGPIFGNAVHFTALAAQEVYSRKRFVNEAQRLVGVLAQRLETSSYVGGADYSIADMAAAPWLQTIERFLPDIVGAPRVAQWRREIEARPAYQRAAALIAEQSALDAASFKTATPEMLDLYFGRAPRPNA